mmetsp:Transcript_33759/g.88713  ORF Transcript_33759/g.88713 Transcript_33759/m.88713 type:complete len:170 (-) Transcript_33759:412-921(-)
MAAGGVQELRAIGLDLLPRAHALEAAGYPADEAASEQGMRMRYAAAPELQFGALLDGELVGFICATRAPGEMLTHESMEEHHPDGPSVCIHSVCVDAAHRRKGIALSLLKGYMSSVVPKLAPPAKRVLLICKENLIPLYQKGGFTLKGPSAVVHGADPWFECEIALDSP